MTEWYKNYTQILTLTRVKEFISKSIPNQFYEIFQHYFLAIWRLLWNEKIIEKYCMV